MRKKLKSLEKDCQHATTTTATAFCLNFLRNAILKERVFGHTFLFAPLLPSLTINCVLWREASFHSHFVKTNFHSTKLDDHPDSMHLFNFMPRFPSSPQWTILSIFSQFGFSARMREEEREKSEIIIFRHLLNNYLTIFGIETNENEKKKNAILI